MWLWALLPISMVVIGNAGIWTVCVIAIQNGSVNITEQVPFVSDCGNFEPQAAYFKQVFNTCGFLGFCISLIRFLLVKNVNKYKKTNIASLVCGSLCFAGSSLLSSFQESSYLSFHMVASAVFFYGGMLFFWLQLFLIYRTEPPRDRRYIGPAMGICCIVLTILGNCIYVLLCMDRTSYSAVCEQIFVPLLFLMFGFFVPEFSRVGSLHLSLAATSTR